jgi:hypothetical protein
MKAAVAADNAAPTNTPSGEPSKAE